MTDKLPPLPTSLVLEERRSPWDVARSQGRLPRGGGRHRSHQRSLDARSDDDEKADDTEVAASRYTQTWSQSYAETSGTNGTSR